MKNLITKLLISVSIILLTGCGANNNVTFSTNSGQCPHSSNTGPYCMGITIQNNSGGSGGQNWINSTNYPISQISYTISGVSNALTPATNPSGSRNSMDPNNCAGSTIQPGGTCEFYVQLNGEAFGVNSQESVNISLTYTVNNTLFGGSTSTGTANITLYELTNLYMGQNTGYMNVYNSAWDNYGYVESSDIIKAVAADNSTYGNVYLGGNLGVYQFGITSNAIAGGSISPSGSSGSNNLFSIGTSLYAALNNGSSYSIHSYSYTAESGWSAPYGSSTTLSSLVSNANTYISNLGATYLTNGTSIYACTSGSSSSGCPTEGISGITGTRTSLAYLGTSTATTSGLYAGTNSSNGGLFYESGTTTPNPSATWALVTGESYPVTIMTSSTSNNVYVGDNQGNVSYVSSESPTTAYTIGNVGSYITSMVYDNYGGMIYVTTNSNQLYQCNPDASGCTDIYAIQNSGSVTGMTIGSMLVDSLNQIDDNGSL